jgi:hypothetical protein
LQRLARLQMHRFDDFSDAISDIAVREARAADTFVALRPNDAPEEPERLIEGALFGSGRNVFLVPGRKPTPVRFDHILIAWNGSRESTRALAEAMPYLHQTHKVTVGRGRCIEAERRRSSARTPSATSSGTASRPS